MELVDEEVQEKIRQYREYLLKFLEFYSNIAWTHDLDFSNLEKIKNIISNIDEVSILDEASIAINSYANDLKKFDIPINDLTEKFIKNNF